VWLFFHYFRERSKTIVAMRKSANLFVITSLFSFFYFFTNAQPPVITGFAPTSGIIGSNVIITGVNFSSSPSANTVFFGAVKATVVSASNTSINVLVPAGANYEPITVTTNGQIASSRNSFNVIFASGGNLNSTSFSNRESFTSDYNPNEVILSDIDLDGKPDVITANNMNINGYGSFSVLRNTSMGDSISFANKVDFVNGSQTYAIAAGDLNGDGQQDIVATSIGQSNISIFKNTSSQGNISFANSISYAAGNSPYGVTIADMDKDGKLDIIAVNATDNTLSIFRNTSTLSVISFAPQINFATGLFPQSISARDLDGDGKIDIAITNKLSNNFSVYRNTASVGSISLAARIDFTNGSGNEPKGIEIADLTGDGKPEIIVMISVNASGSTGFAQVFKNNCTSGNFLFPYLGGVTGSNFSNAYHINTGDLNGDGKPDFAMGVTGNYFVKVFQNNYDNVSGFFDFSNSQQYNSPGTYTIAIGDLNADGKPEIISSFFNSNSITVFKNRCGQPGIIDFSPSSGGAGVVVTINGNNLNNITSVTFGGVPAASFTVVNDQMITATVANGATGDIKLSGSNGNISISGFVYFPAPSITSFTPSTAAAGTVVTINGQNLSTVSAVSFGGTPATYFTVMSNTEVQAIVGSGSSGNITLSTLGGNALASGFIYIPAPQVMSISPSTGTNGTIVTITGNNFNNATEVNFGITPAASFSVLSSTSIQATVLGGSSGSVTVTTPGGSAAVAGFTFVSPPAPSITNFTPFSGVPGTVITLTGNNFSTNPLLNTVYVGGVRAQVISSTATQLMFAIPVNATHGSISVTTNYLTAMSNRLFIPTFAGNQTLDNNSFEAPVYINTFLGTGSNNVIADMDNDGKNDIVVSGAILRNTSITNSNITFANEYRFTSVQEVAVADLDGDGKKDIIGTSASFYLNIIKNNSTPGNLQTVLEPLIYVVNNVYEIGVADFNKDGKVDLVFGSNGKVVFLQNTSTVNHISFAAPLALNVGLYNPSVAIGDFDGDDKVDVATLNSFGNTVSFFRNVSTVNGALNFVLESTSYPTRVDIPYTAGPYHIMADDFNGDGKADITISNGSASLSVSVLQNASSTGTISFLPRLDFFTGTIEPLRSGSADLDGDAKTDMLYAHEFVPRTTAFMKNISSPNNVNFAAQIMLLEGANHAAADMQAGDLNADGKPDIIVNSQNTILIYRNIVPAASNPSACIGLPFSFSTNILGNSFQWQEDTGLGYLNLQDNNVYAGVHSAILSISNITSVYGRKYRCLTDGVTGNENLLKLTNQWTGAINNAWENPGNWSCNIVPDENTDVKITAGMVNISTNTSIASLQISSNVSLNIAQGINLIILH
jgi:hypothetical protein